MASSETVGLIESILAEGYPQAGPWFEEEGPQVGIFRRAWAVYDDDLMLDGMTLLVRENPEYGGTHFLGELMQRVEPLQEKRWSDREGSRTAQEGDAPPEAMPAGPTKEQPPPAGQGNLPGTEAPRHGDGVYIYSQRDAPIVRDTLDDRRASMFMMGKASPFSSLVQKAEEQPKKTDQPGAIGCPWCAHRGDRQRDMEIHWIVHYPPGVQAFYATQRGADLESIRKQTVDLHRGICWGVKADDEGNLENRMAPRACGVCRIVVGGE